MELEKQQWQDRIRNEKAEFEKKLYSLAFFMATDRFSFLDEFQKKQMETQYEAMHKYHASLDSITQMFCCIGENNG